MNFKTTIVLLVLLIAAGAYIIIDHYVGRKDKPDEVTDPRKLFDVKKSEDVTSLTIKSADGSEIVITKDDKNKWKMTKPVAAAAESWQVDGLVRDLIELQSTGQVDAAGKGLEKPKFHVEVAAKGGKLLKFDIGDKTQLGTMYVKVQGKDKADVVSADVYDRLSKPANDLRDKQLVTSQSTEIRQLNIDAEGQRLALQKKGNDWELIEPAKMPADESVMTDLLGAVTGLRATDWIANDSSEVAKAQFDKPQMVVSFTTAAPTTQPTTAPASQPKWTSITFGQFEDIRHNKVYAKISDSGAIVKVSNSPLETLTKKPLDIRDKKLLDIDPAQVSRLSIATNLPAATSPPRPETKTTVLVERRKQLPPETPKPKAPETQPVTKPATQAATKPTTTAVAATAPTSKPATTQSTQPARPPSPWVLNSDPKGDADEEMVGNVLNELHPFRVTKYLESLPTTRPSGTYTLKFTTEGPGGTPVNNHEMTFIDPGNEQPLLGAYNGLTFEAARTFLSKLEGNFARKPASEAGKPVNPHDFELPGKK